MKNESKKIYEKFSPAQLGLKIIFLISTALSDGGKVTCEKENLRFGLVNFTATKGLRYPLVFS